MSYYEITVIIVYVMIWVEWIVPSIVYCVVIKKPHIYIYTCKYIYIFINRIWEIKYGLVRYVIIVTLSCE
jgi:hypothetical protein